VFSRQSAYLVSQAGLFSAVSSAFVIDIHSKLRPDPNDQSAALLRAILLTLNQSAIPGETPVVPPVQDPPPNEIVAATGLLYASLLISLLAAFIAMLGKQWLNRYLRRVGGSMIERCGDRQRKCNGLQKWPFHFFVEGLPVMLQVALLLLACGLCRFMASINASIAGILITITVLGVLFYAGVVIAGTSSYDCPFQTPGSGTLRSLWTKIGPYLTPTSLQIITALYNLGEIVQRHTPRPATHLSHIDIQRYFRSLLEWVQLRFLRIGLGLPRTELNIRRRLRHPPLPTIRENSPSADSQQVVPWLTSKDLTTIQMASANDARCVSWILWNITDPEALDAAIRLAGMIRWFEDGSDVKPPYDLIVSIFQTCFDSNRIVYPGSKDRAYYSGRAILWIHALAMCRSEEFARSFPLPTTGYTASDDFDLSCLLLIIAAPTPSHRLAYMLIQQGSSPSHMQWISNVLLHLSWATRTPLAFDYIRRYMHLTHNATASVDIILNCLLTWCNFLGSPVEEEVLKVQDKSCETTCFLLSKLLTLSFTSDRLERILHQLSNAIVSVLNNPNPRSKFIPGVLQNLTKLENRPECLKEMAYEWCSVISENRQSCEDWENLIVCSLSIGFRHLDPSYWWIPAKLTHTEHHRELPGVVFKSGKSEVIADLLQAWTANGVHRGSPLLNICAEHLVGLHNTVPFSPRLRKLVVRSVALIGYKRFAEEGAGRFVELLNHLHLSVGDLDDPPTWVPMLLETVQSREGTQSLSVQSWELLAELTTSCSWVLEDSVYSPQVVVSLLEAQEWEKLECWMGVVWMVWPPQTDVTTGDLEHVMVSLFRQRPGAVQKLTQWMERWSEIKRKEMPEAFQRICEQPTEVAQLGAP
jgi:hypothetical protein